VSISEIPFNIRVQKSSFHSQNLHSNEVIETLNLSLNLLSQQYNDLYKEVILLNNFKKLSKKKHLKFLASRTRRKLNN
jgi:hypothetical protein